MNVAPRGYVTDSGKVTMSADAKQAFVAFEGYDTIAVLADAPRSHGTECAHCRILAVCCSRRHSRTDSVLPRAGHQRLAMGLGPNPSR